MTISTAFFIASTIHRILREESEAYAELALRHRFCCDGMHIAVEVMDLLEVLSFLDLAGLPTNTRVVSLHLDRSLSDTEMLLLAASEARLVSFHG